ncbi:uncharacterized protein TNCV_2751291 [Trichonephila clavipes]|nr:uncharacterized protein TNCV_2751291 [Trichonephila clavipes]
MIENCVLNIESLRSTGLVQNVAREDKEMGDDCDYVKSLLIRRIQMNPEKCIQFFIPNDEAHIWLNGYVNKQNCCIWSEANPQVYVETPLHPEKLTVWCALWAGGIIGPYFFKNDEGHNVTVNGNRYRAMITNFFIHELNNHDLQELWFQQDGGTCHTARAPIDLLKDTFGDRQISRFGTVNWPPRSFDLTPLDYFLWGYVKALVYADKPQTLDHFSERGTRDDKSTFNEKGWYNFVVKERDSNVLHIGGVGTSESERCHLHEDQALDALDRPVVQKIATPKETHTYS